MLALILRLRRPTNAHRVELIAQMHLVGRNHHAAGGHFVAHLTGRADAVHARRRAHRPASRSPAAHAQAACWHRTGWKVDAPMRAVALLEDNLARSRPERAMILARCSSSVDHPREENPRPFDPRARHPRRVGRRESRGPGTPGFSSAGLAKLPGVVPWAPVDGLPPTARQFPVSLQGRLHHAINTGWFSLMVS